MPQTLDLTSPIPLYHQLKAYIEAQISTGAWTAGERVPSESELGDRFQISRTTVRQAIGELVNEGLLTRIQGKGTFVSQPRIQQHLAQLTSFTQDMRTRQRRPSSKILQFIVMPCPAQTAAALQIGEGEPVYKLKRLRMADENPMAVETAYLTHRLFPTLMEEDLGNQSLYETLKLKFNTAAARATQQMEAIACPSEEARLLGMHKGCPILHIYRTTYNQDNRPFENVESYYRSDSYIFHVEIFSK